VRDFWDNGLVTNVNVAVARSSERNNVRLSVGRTGEAGMYPSNSNTRTDLAIAGGTQISNRWSAEASINYINDGMQNQPAQAYEEIDPMQNFIWFGRQVDTRLLKDNLYRNLSDPLTQQILGATTCARTHPSSTAGTTATTQIRTGRRRSRRPTTRATAGSGMHPSRTSSTTG